METRKKSERSERTPSGSFVGLSRAIFSYFFLSSFQASRCPKGHRLSGSIIGRDKRPEGRWLDPLPTADVPLRGMKSASQDAVPLRGTQAVPTTPIHNCACLPDRQGLSIDHCRLCWG